MMNENYPARMKKLSCLLVCSSYFVLSVSRFVMTVYCLRDNESIYW